MPQIEFKNITKEYKPAFLALDGVTFSIDKGEFIFLVGPSGAGKSTIVKMLIGEEAPTSGEIYFNGENVLNITGDSLASHRRKIGVVFQDFKLLGSKTVFENVAIALDVVNSSNEVINNVVPNVLTVVGLQDKTVAFPDQLSGGEKQRLSIARALAHEPDVLVADEPTGMIDPASSAEVVMLLEKINSLGTTILMASHDQDVVNKLKKRVIRLENGRIKSDMKGGYYANNTDNLY